MQQMQIMAQEQQKPRQTTKKSASKQGRKEPPDGAPVSDQVTPTGARAVGRPMHLPWITKKKAFFTKSCQFGIVRDLSHTYEQPPGTRKNKESK